MTFCAVIPDRGDREELTEFCLHRLSQMKTVEPCLICHIKDKPESDKIDLVSRVYRATLTAKAEGIDFCFIIENDDYYPLDYFERLADFKNYDFIGFDDTKYYNLKQKTFERFDHRERSSLFCTGFRLSALDKFEWPPNDYKWLDIKLWEYARRFNKRIKLLKDNPCVGMKGHGSGLCAGKGHVMLLKNKDPDLSVLKTAVDEEAFTFYCDLMKRL